ncbi:MAG: hypothetical protein H6732_10670 [Alphaproteobacteria bacterium]|nr:hypothetical protein [Alphaproteobacteria bacterium]
MTDVPSLPSDDDAGSRARTVPTASSPQLLTHLLELVARGVRSPRGLQEALGVDVRTVQYYLQAGVWLSLLEDAPEPRLSPDGLGYVYAGPDRPERYARAVHAQPFVQELVRLAGPSPDADALEAAIRRAEPSLAPSTVARRASAIRGLLAPALDPGRLDAPDGLAQLDLPLSQAPTVAPPEADLRLTGTAFSPDLYRVLLCTLVDQGELTLGHVRGLLDQAGASTVPVGTYVELALTRGDAVRLEERLVVAEGAVARRELAASTASVILSDDGWRSTLDRVRSGEQPGEGSPWGRYRPWTRRLLGAIPAEGAVDEALARVLRDRSLDSFPRSGAPGTSPPRVHEPFLACWDTPGLAVALPPSLVQLWEGVAGTNRRLRNARHRADAVGTPTLAYRPVAVHGGLLHPGETLPRAIPDARTLRQRVVACAPYAALTTAMLLAHRTRDARVELTREGGSWLVRRGPTRLGGLLDLLDGFGRHLGWRVSRRGTGGLGEEVLTSLLERLGVAVPVGSRLVLDDAFFTQLRQDDEATLLRGLGPLAEALAGYLDGLAGRETGR